MLPTGSGCYVQPRNHYAVGTNPTRLCSAHSECHTQAGSESCWDVAADTSMRLGFKSAGTVGMQRILYVLGIAEVVASSLLRDSKRGGWRTWDDTVVCVIVACWFCVRVGRAMRVCVCCVYL